MVVNEQAVLSRMMEVVNERIILKKFDEIPEGTTVMELIDKGLEIHDELLKLNLNKEGRKSMQSAIDKLKTLRGYIQKGGELTKGQQGAIAMFYCNGLYLLEGE